MNYTAEQLSAINTRDRSLLVSAAAGAGKTATLTKRIITALLDPNNPEDISRMLIVTFTNAAVGELKARIGAAIEEALRLAPENRALERQLMLLPTASISTIDAFCNGILKKNADKVGAPTNYRIADAAEFELLARGIMRGLINAVYDGKFKSIPSDLEFQLLTEALTSSKRNEDLEDVLINLYNKSKSAPEGVGIFEKLTQEYLTENPGKDGKFAKYAVNCLHDMAKHYGDRILKVSMSLDPEDKRQAAYAKAFYEAHELTAKLLELSDYSSIRDFIRETKLSPIPSFRNYEKPDAVLWGIELRADLKKHLQRIGERLFLEPDCEWNSLYRELYSTLSLLSKLLVEFDKLYTEEKTRRGMLEYSDVERYACLALYENGRPSDVALAVREEYTSVYIDEYQDVNALQGMIFDAISKPGNRFMVGDIKQSIYGFRSADPDIFANMKKSFPPLKESAAGGSAAIFMSDNFRCDKGIIDFVNCVFDKIFGAVKESIGYVAEDRLGFKKTYDGKAPELRPVEFILVEGITNSRQGGGGDDDDSGESANDRVRSAECATVANRIQDILKNGRLNNGSRPRPKDIAVIIRRNKNRLSDYAEALEALGIPTLKTEDKEFFLNAEVLLALSLLNAINNPKKDIYLAGLLMSPIYKFTPDELYFIRRAGGRTLYDSLMLYTKEHPEWKKGNLFLSELERFRLLAEGMPTDAFILRLFKDTGLIELAKGRTAREHLFLLYDYAKRFSSSSYQGLYNFIRFINNVIDNGTKLDTAPHSSHGDAVHIITVHASKGLEYPIVFYVDTDAPFYDGGSKERVAYSEKFGMALCLHRRFGNAIVDNVAHRAINHRSYRGYVEEEFRVSYVALTRAREQLYVVGCTPLDTDKYLQRLKFEGENLSSFSVYDFKCALDFMLATASADAKITRIEKYSDKEEENAEEEQIEVISQPDFDDTGITAELLSSRFNFRYRHGHLTRIPEKLSISRLHPAVLDGSEDEECRLLIEKCETSKKERVRLPDFYTGCEGDESAKRGTATHLFMQFFDPESLSAIGAKGELERLFEKGFISKEDKERVRLGEIEAFAKSSFLDEMRNADELYREFRFNTRLAAKYFTKDPELRSLLGGEELLVQGVIDCVFRDKKGNYHLVDYKTDRLSKAQLADKELAAEVLNRKHSLQLSYYALAVEKIFGKAPESVRIYSLPLGETVAVTASL